MSKRKLLYGYQIQNGELTVVKAEASVVARVASLYLEGLSYQKLADLLNQKNIPFSQEAPAWDKHKVKRLLENPRYTGQKGYLPRYSGHGDISMRPKPHPGENSETDPKSGTPDPQAGRSPTLCLLRLHAVPNGWQEPQERHVVLEVCSLRHHHHHTGRDPVGGSHTPNGRMG